MRGYQPARSAALLALLCGACALTSDARAAEAGRGGTVTVRAGVEAGRLTGWTLYHITVPTEQGLVESELEWSLDSWLGGVTVSLEGETRWSAELSLLANLSGNPGTMQDSDWLDGVLIVFSESEVEQDAFSTIVIDFAGEYLLLRRPKWSLSGTAGILYERFDLTAANLVQFSPAGLTEFNVLVPGPVVTYTVTYTVPYAGAVLDLSLTPKTDVTLAALGGYAVAADEDDHLLRFKLSQAETDGFALMARASATYAVSPRLALTASLEALSIETGGEQEQFFYGGRAAGTGFAGVADEIDTAQLLVTLAARYRF